MCAAFFSFWPFHRDRKPEPSPTQSSSQQEKSDTTTNPTPQEIQASQLPQDTPITAQSLQKALNNLQNQLESYINLQLFFSHGQLLPQFHGWPINPDFAVHIIRLIQNTPYDAIFEFGSGSSTVIVAKALQVFQRTNTIHTIFEHKAEFLEKTRLLLPPKAEEQSKIYLTPLVPYKETSYHFMYYDCAKILADYAAKLKDAEPCRILCLVDGPPGFICKNSRYPVVTHMLTAFSHLRFLDILLDDFNRKEEQECGQAWICQLKTKGFSVHHEMLPFEKGAFFLRARK